MHERKRNGVGRRRAVVVDGEEKGREANEEQWAGSGSGWRDRVGKWRTVKRDVLREEREDSGWREDRGKRAGEREMGNRERERGNLWQRVDRKRSAEKCTTSALVWQLCGRTTASACVRKRERERRRAGEGETEKEGERKGLTEAEGRPTYIRRPIPTQGEEDERRAKPSRVGLGQVYPSSTHTALSCVCHPAEENHTKAEAQPLREREDRRGFPVLASGFSESVWWFFKKKKKEEGKESACRVHQLRVSRRIEISVPKWCENSFRESRWQCARRRMTLREEWHGRDTPIGSK